MRTLQLSEEIYRVLYEDNPSMYFAVDTQGVVLSVNRFGAEVLGHPVESLLGQPVIGVFHEDDRVALSAQLDKCFAEPGRVFEWELRKVRRDGEVLWVRERARSVETDGEGTIVLIVCEDITERRRTKKELRESRERYRTLYTKTPALLHSIDSEHRVIDVSQHWLQVMGYDRTDVIGRPVTDFMTNESKDRALLVGLPNFLRDGMIRDLEYQFVKKDGGTVDVMLSAIAERDDDGEFVRSLTVMVDTTEWNRAEQLLRETRDELEQRVIDRTEAVERQRAFLRQVIDVDPNFIFAKDRDGRFTLVNQAVADAYGTTVEDLIGRSDADFNPDAEEVEFFRRTDLEVFETHEERFIGEESVTAADGCRRWLQTVKRPIFDEDGVVTQVLGSATDITRRKEAEALLRDSEEALRRSEKGLRQLAGKLLTAQEEERRRLAREIHDDLAQRLAGLSLQTGRIEQELSASGATEVAEHVAKVNEELSRLSRDVHDMSRQLHPSMLEHLGLEDAIRTECEGFSNRSGIRVEFVSEEVPQELSKELGICFYRITQEALHNISRHAQTSEAQVTLTRSNDNLELGVRDNGAGFDPDCPDRARGIGLASMQERARLIQAEFEIEASPGAGTTIRLRAPLGSGF